MYAPRVIIRQYITVGTTDVNARAIMDETTARGTRVIVLALPGGGVIHASVNAVGETKSAVLVNVNGHITHS